MSSVCSIPSWLPYSEAGHDRALLVEFSAGQGRTIELAALKPDQLPVLHRQIIAARPETEPNSVR